MKIVSTTFLLLLSSTATVAAAEKICVAPCDDVTGICTYHVKVNLFAGELGYYTFDECGDDSNTNPTIGMQAGKTYKFVQSDRSNYYHPLGFAYFPDGAHADVDELEPGIVPPGSTSTCDTTNGCPAPMYYENGEYLGKYSNLVLPGEAGGDTGGITIEQVADEVQDEDFGLDHYEPKFFHPFGDWLSYGPFEIMLRFDVDDFNQDLFYFCHIHQYMTGRIKLVDENNEPINAENEPVIDYEYDAIDSFDEKCGTFNTSTYQLPHAECPERFVCDVAEGSTTSLSEFSECMDAMNCAMMAGMTTHATSEIGLFIHQMIPHHQNAVNMAKALLKTGSIECDDLTDEDDPKCTMQVMMREIINGQNAQIQRMRAVLETLEEPAYADCVVPVFSEQEVETAKMATTSTAAAALTKSFGMVATLIFVVVATFMI